MHCLIIKTHLQMASETKYCGYTVQCKTKDVKRQTLDLNLLNSSDIELIFNLFKIFVCFNANYIN